MIEQQVSEQRRRDFCFVGDWAVGDWLLLSSIGGSKEEPRAPTEAGFRSLEGIGAQRSGWLSPTPDGPVQHGRCGLLDAGRASR
jgi:hypothetical protein